MLTKSGGCRRHLERREGKSSVRVDGTADSNLIEGLIVQKWRLVKKFQVAGKSGHSVINQVRVWFFEVNCLHHCKPSVKPLHTNAFFEWCF